VTWRIEYLRSVRKAVKGETEALWCLGVGDLPSHRRDTALIETRCIIRSMWDGEAGVWVATSEDVPGLVAEADSIDALSDKLEVLVPELLLVNGLCQRQGASLK